MSSQSYIFNPTERTLAAAGDGFSCPRLTTAGRTALSLTVGDKGMMVYDTTLTDLCIWNGTAWEFIGDSSNGWVSVKNFGAKGDGVTDDTAAIQAATNYAVANNVPLYAPKGVYLLSSTVNLTGLSTLFGDGKSMTSFVSNNVLAPIFEVGGIFSPNYHDFAVGYGTLNTTGILTAICFNQTGNIRRGSIRRIQMAEAYYGWKSGGGGTTWLYSVSMSDLETAKIRGVCFYIDSTVGGSTGNIFDNIYCNFFENDGVTKIPFVNAFYLSAISECSFRQINIEHGKSGNPIFIGASAFNTSWESVHFEGVEATDDFSGFIYANGTGVHCFRGVTVYSCDFLLSNLGPGNFYSLFRQATGSKIILDSLHWDSNIVDGGVTTTLSNNNGGTYPDPNSWFELGFTSGDMTGLTVVVAENNSANEGTWQKTYLFEQGDKQAERPLGVLYGAGDGNQTYLPNKQRMIYRFGVTLTANRTLTLSTVGAFNGLSLRVVRTAGSGGAFTVDVGGLKSLATAQWCEVVYNGSSWELLQFGSL